MAEKKPSRKQQVADAAAREQLLNVFGGDWDSARKVLGISAVKAHRLFKGVDVFDELERLAQADGKLLPYANRTVRRWALSEGAMGAGMPYRPYKEDGTRSDDWHYQPTTAKEKMECLKLLSAMEGENLNNATMTKIVVSTGIDRAPGEVSIETTTENPLD